MDTALIPFLYCWKVLMKSFIVLGSPSIRDLFPFRGIKKSFTKVETNKDDFFYVGFTDPAKSILQILERCFFFVHSIHIFFQNSELQMRQQNIFYTTDDGCWIYFLPCSSGCYSTLSIDIMITSVSSAPFPKNINVFGISTLQIKNLQISSSDLPVMLIIVEKISVEVSCFV